MLMTGRISKRRRTMVTLIWTEFRTSVSHREQRYPVYAQMQELDMRET